MPERIATKDYYADADGKLVGADKGTIIVARKGTVISDEVAERYGLKVQDTEVYDAVADHEEKHGNETDAEAQAKRTSMMEGVPDPDGPAVEGERGAKGRAATDNKALAKAPANKGT